MNHQGLMTHAVEAINKWFNPDPVAQEVVASVVAEIMQRNPESLEAATAAFDVVMEELHEKSPEKGFNHWQPAYGTRLEDGRFWPIARKMLGCRFPQETSPQSSPMDTALRVIRRLESKESDEEKIIQSIQDLILSCSQFETPLQLQWAFNRIMDQLIRDFPGRFELWSPPTDEATAGSKWLAAVQELIDRSISGG